jgi:hypothetical protein
MAEASELSRSITEFLSTAGMPQIQHCHKCGSLMDHIGAVICFAGKHWDVALPVCRRCTPESADFIDPRNVA